MTPSLKRHTPMAGSLSLCGTLSHSLPRSVFEKTPLGTLKNFFRCVKAKPDNLVGVSCRDFVPPEKAWPFQVVQVGGIAENPRAFGRCLPPCTKAQNTHRGDGARYPSTSSPKSTIPAFRILRPSIKSMLPAHRKSFRIDSFFKRGRRVQGGSPAKSAEIGGEGL